MRTQSSGGLLPGEADMHPLRCDISVLSTRASAKALYGFESDMVEIAHLNRNNTSLRSGPQVA
jgi:hypothetical protein